MSDELKEALASKELGKVLDALIDVGKGGHKELAPAVAPYVDHAEAYIRGAAILTLGFYLRLPEWREKAEQMAWNDPDSEARSDALTAWASYYRQTSSASVLLRLDGLLRDVTQHPDVRAMAYWSMLMVSTIPRDQWPKPKALWDIDEEVDWTLVDRILDGAR